MRKIGLLLVLVLFLTVSKLGQAKGSDTGFFPTPPPSVTYHTATGVLQSYGIGMKSGIVRIKPSLGNTIDFYVSTTMTINGKSIKCVDPQRFFCQGYKTAQLLMVLPVNQIILERETGLEPATLSLGS